jgi:uncharacterized membrane protein
MSDKSLYHTIMDPMIYRANKMDHSNDFDMEIKIIDKINNLSNYHFLMLISDALDKIKYMKK